MVAPRIVAHASREARRTRTRGDPLMGGIARRAESSGRPAGAPSRMRPAWTERRRTGAPERVGHPMVVVNGSARHVGPYRPQVGRPETSAAGWASATNPRALARTGSGHPSISNRCCTAAIRRWWVAEVVVGTGCRADLGGGYGVLHHHDDPMFTGRFRKHPVALIDPACARPPWTRREGNHETSFHRPDRWRQHRPAGSGCRTGDRDRDRDRERGVHTPHAKHVLLLSVDGLHQSDLARYVSRHPHSALAALVARAPSTPTRRPRFRPTRSPAWSPS